MAAKVNTRFIFIIATIAGAVLIAGGGLYYYMMRINPGRNIRNGDALMAQGDYEAARKEYGRAVSKDPHTLLHLQKYGEALAMIRPETVEIANLRYKDQIGVLALIAEQRPSDVEAQQALLEELYQSARLANDPFLWDQLSAFASESRNRYAGDYRTTPIAFYLAVASDRRRASLSLAQSEVDQIEADLITYVENHPEDDRGLAALIFSRMSQADQFKAQGRTRASEQKLVDADLALQEATQLFPDSIEVAMIEVRRMAQRRFAGDTDFAAEELEAGISRIESMGADTDSIMYLTDIAGLLAGVGAKNGRSRAVEIVQSYLERHPEDMLAHWIVAALTFELNELDRSEEAARWILGTKALPTSFLAQFRYDLLRRAAKKIFDVEFRRYEMAAAEDQDMQLAKCREARQTLADMYAKPEEERQVALCDARLALAAREYVEAAVKFQQVLRDPTFNADAWTLYGASQAQVRVREPGRARELLLQALEIQPRNPRILIELARLRIDLGEYVESLEHAEAALELDPENLEALGFQAIARQKLGIQAEDERPLIRVTREITEALQAEDYELARTLVVKAIADFPEQPQLKLAHIQVEVAAGNSDAALVLIDEVLTEYPDNRLKNQLASLRDQLRGTDRIEALETKIDQETSDEGERAVRIFVRLNQYVNQERQKEQQALQAGDDASAAAASAEMVRLQSAADRYLPVAMDLRPAHPDLIEARFQIEMFAEDWQAAEEVIADARAANSDGARGLVYQGRYELVRKNFAAAAEALAEATEILPHTSSDVWRMLGRAYEGVGNIDGALAAYENAYQSRPNDMLTVQYFVKLLLDTGEKGRALTLLRDSKVHAGDDVRFRDARLALELDVGRPIVAMSERIRIEQEQPEDKSNALQLVGLLGSRTPDWELIVNPATGGPAFTAQEWSVMLPATRDNIVKIEKEKWVREGERILQRLHAAGSDEFDVVVTESRFYRDQGKVDRGEQILRDFIERQAKPTIDMMLALAQYQISLSREGEALRTLQQALPLQDPKSFQADLAMAGIFFKDGQYERAISHYEKVPVSDRDPWLDFRIIECNIRLRDYDTAEAALQTIVDDETSRGAPSTEVALLQAQIARHRGDDLWARGQREGADAEYAREQSYIDGAINDSPTAVLPYVARARLLKRQFDRTDRLTLLDDALLDLSRAGQLRATFVPVLKARAEILLTKIPPDTSGAIRQFRQILDAAPRDWDSRRELIGLLLAVRDIQQAIELTTETITLNPEHAGWNILLGDLLVADQSHVEAAAAYQKAFDVTDSLMALAKVCQAHLGQRPPDASSVTSLLEARQEDMNTVPMLRCYLAKARALGGAWDQALNEMRTAFAVYQSIASKGSGNPQVYAEWFDVIAEIFGDRPPEEADEFILSVLAVEPDTYLLEQMGRVWSKRGSAGYSRSVELLDRALNLTSADDKDRQVTLLMQLALIRNFLGEHEVAAGLYERLLDMQPEHVLALNNLAYLYSEDLNQPQKGLPLSLRALDQRPNSYNILDTVGVIQFRLGRLEDAEASLRRSVDLGTDAGNHLHLGQVLIAAGDFGEARRYLTKGLELRPNVETQSEIERLLDDIRNKRN